MWPPCTLNYFSLVAIFFFFFFFRDLLYYNLHTGHERGFLSRADDLNAIIAAKHCARKAGYIEKKVAEWRHFDALRGF